MLEHSVEDGNDHLHYEGIVLTIEQRTSKLEYAIGGRVLLKRINWRNFQHCVRVDKRMRTHVYQNSLFLALIF